MRMMILQFMLINLANRIKESQKTIVVHIFKISKPFIDKTRMVENKPNIYIEFEGFIGMYRFTNAMTRA